MGKVWGGVLLVTGVLACPCHLPLTLSLLAGVLGGAGAGSLLGGHTGLLYGVFTGYFLLSIGAGWYLLNRKGRNKAAVSCQVPHWTSATKRIGEELSPNNTGC